MGNISTNWMQATTDPNDALIGLVSCVESNKNAWIEIRKNGDQDHPILITNPLLDNPFNWEPSFSVLRTEDELEGTDYLNETEKDLAYNWIGAFGTKEAIEVYQKDGTIKEGLINGGSINHPVRINDANAYRRDITGDNYKYGYYVQHWKPKAGIKPYIVDDSIDEVFVICYDDEPVDKKKALLRAARFLVKYVEIKYPANPTVKEEAGIWKVGVAYENYGYIKVTKEEAATEQEAIEVAKKKLHKISIVELEKITEPLEETKEIDTEGVLEM